MDVEVLMKKGQRGAAAYIQECCRSSRVENLNKLLDTFLDPSKSIDEWETIEWLRWLMAGGCTPDEFAATVRRYDNATTCGLVWTVNFVAYRCRTCGISPCMSLCGECFQRGNHKGHDFNMFRSQAGGACDCGDTNVMKESGFCYLHGPHAEQHDRLNDQSAPPDLLCVANAMMPRLFLRLIQLMRQHCGDLNKFMSGINAGDKFITMLHDMSSMGAAMRQVMTLALTNPQIYKRLTEVDEGSVTPEYYQFMMETKRSYEEALTSFPNAEAPEEYKDIPSLQKTLVHKSFLEEFVFWTAKFEFPQKVVVLLLNLLPDNDYKEAFTRAFVLHYSRISQLLLVSKDPDTLSNRVVHVSVQLFSNEKLALRMTEQLGLLHVMVISLKCMMAGITKPCTLSKSDRNMARVVDCADPVMKNHCYWPLVSDLNNILSHRPVAIKFLEDDGLLKMWFDLISLFQGMNVNIREMNQHVEYEPNTYYAAFSAELEASASPMWALISHLKDSSTAHLTKNLLRHCRSQLRLWLESVSLEVMQSESVMQISFHLPLHRYFSVFLYQAVRHQGLLLPELLPPPQELKAIVFHPLRVQAGFYEILSGLWVRNGLQMKGQAMTYIQCHFCNSMVDADLFLLQVAMMNLPHGEFLNSVFERFHVLESLSISSSVTNCFLEPEHEMPMMDNCLLFLATLASVRTSIGMSESDLFTLEMITLLCMGDKTHSLLIELMPERCGNSSHTKDFESVLSKVAEYKPPHLESSGLMSQGTYVPKPFVWETLYDPIYLLLRAVHRKEFQNSLDRFTEFAKHTGKFKGSGSLWPPYRIPTNASEPYTDPRHILLSKVLQGVLFVIFYKAVNTSHLSDQVVALAVYLLEMALSVCDSIGPQVICPHEISYARIDTEFASWYKTDCLLANLRTEIDSVYVKTNPSVTSDSSEDVSVDDNMEVESYDGEVDMYDSYDSGLIALISSTTDYPMAESHSSGISHSHQPLAIMPNTVAESSSPSMLVPLPERPSRPPPALAMSPAAIATTSSTPQITTSVSLPALPPPSARPSGGSEEEVAVATSTGVRMDEIQRQRGLQVVLAPAKPLATVPKKELVERNSSMNNRDAAVEVVVNESMISLLLKLHSKLSSCPDSYVPFWEQPEALKIIDDAKSGLDSRLTIHIIPVDTLLASSSSGSGSSSDSTGGAEASLFRLPGQSPDRSPNQTLIDSETEFHEFSYSQLYSILNPIPDDPISRIGDGTFFVGKLLNQIAAKDDACREAIVSTRSKLWPRTTENADELKQREQREKELRRKAMERRQKLLAEMHRMQEKFMENFSDGATGAGAGGSSVGGSTDNIADNDNEIPEETIKPVEYDCVICNQTSPSTADNPMGLVILLQSSSTLGHRRKKGSRSHRLPTNDEEKHKLTAEDTMTYYNEQRLEEFSTHFDDSSWLLSISGGWEGGVHVQTCGHHLHMECLVGYLSALRSQQKQHSVAFDRGEYSCPLCRQLANSFIPLSPEFGIRQSALVKDRKNTHHHAPLTPEITVPEIPPSPEANVALEVMKLLREYPLPTPAAKITDAITKTMEEMTNATMLKYRQIGHSKNSKSISLFVSSIARSNLEIEIVTRGGNLVSVQTEPQPSTSSASTVSPTAVSKRSCIVPLLYVLGYHYKILSAEPCSSKLWERILGIRFLPDSSLMPVDREVPMLLRDPCTILLHLLMQLPVHVDLAYFTEMVQGIYNLVYVQILCGLSCRFSEKERENWKTRTSMLSRNTPGDFNELNVLFGHIIRYLESSPLYIPDSDYGDRDYESKLKDKKDMGYTERELDSKIQGLLLPYLRVAALLRHQIYEQELPFISTKAEEFGFLARFLCLGGREQRESTGILGDGPAMDDCQDEESLLDIFKAHKFLQWISPTPLTAIWTWCEDLISFIVRARSSASYLIETHHVLWDQPRLLDLPHAYDDIFQFYHRKACPNCGQVPKDPNVCLVCGMLVCMRDSCCKQPNGGVCEAIQHSVDCGAGTAIFLSVNLSTIVVVRGRRACLWGSVYLDRFGEEDRDLKRGRPLFLSKERYALLNQQWISHRFDHTNRKWIWHRDGL